MKLAMIGLGRMGGNMARRLMRGGHQIIACDRQGSTGDTSHHRGGINVLFDNGTTRFLDREELGLGPDDPIVVGPDAKHEMLRQVVTVSQRE